MTELCEFSKGLCIHCGDTEQGECEGWNPPPKREWVGLTDHDIFEAEFNRPELMTIGEFISNKLKELNS